MFRRADALLAAIAIAMTPPGLAAGNPESGARKAAACIACHGADGNSPAEMWPKLAGQLPEYIVKQLQDFKTGKRHDEQMSPQAANLAEVDLADIAAFFAAQAIAPAAGDAALRAQGEQLYLKGKGRPTPVTACVGCHGPRGAGNRDWPGTMSHAPVLLAPAIGGQHAAYVAKQLRAYRDGRRRNDPARVMREVVRGLDDAEVSALAAYVAALGR
jgi:cytochrome c553